MNRVREAHRYMAEHIAYRLKGFVIYFPESGRFFHEDDFETSHWLDSQMIENQIMTPTFVWWDWIDDAREMCHMIDKRYENIGVKPPIMDILHIDLLPGQQDIRILKRERVV